MNARFPLLQYLGGSRHSAFYLTEVSGQRAAIKLLPAGTRRSSAQVTSWKLAARLSHPNLVRILEAGQWHADEEQDMLFVVMEYCEESLADVLRDRQLTAAEARELLIPTLSALKYLHSQGLLHGQIKPAHLLANGDQLKLSCDTIHRNGEGHPSAIESPYDAPEKASGTISLSGDVWSLGITLFEALTGHLPGGNTKAAEKLPVPFDAIVSGCLMREREKRLSLSAIRAMLDKRPAETPVNSSPETPSAHKETSKIIVLPAAASLPMEVIRPTATSEAATPAPAATTPLKREFSQAFGGLKRKPLLIVAAVIALLAIVVGMRLLRTGSNAATSPIAANPHPLVSPTPAAKSIEAPHATSTTPSSGSVLHQVMPAVTTQARNTINGTVKVKVLVNVDTNGRVSRAKLATRGPSTYFASQALEAARQWTFTAPVRDGRPEASEWAIHFEFRRSGTKINARQSSRG